MKGNVCRRVYSESMGFAETAVSRIGLVKPDKARSIEDMILNAAKRGALTEKVSEERLIELLEQVNEQTSQKTKVTIQRRRRVFDDDDDDDDTEED